MSNGLVAFLFAAGGSTWVYTYMMRRSGDNTKSAITVAGIAGAFGFVGMLVVLAVVQKMVS
ncbi:MAG TPA: hypothetical protein PKB09_00575 [Candidatus Saccharibacteria bacterium]|nr:hypothetical protein [Candidatus Saccharibacteria bacterium]